MKKLNYILITLGLLLILVPFLIPVYNLFRCVALMIGIIILILGLTLNRPKKAFKVILYFVIINISLYTLDYFSFKIFKAMPIMVYKVDSSDKVSTYNSLFYRIYECDGKKISDENYEKAFACEPSSLKEYNINELFTNPKESYKENKGKFIKVIGKIHSVVGNESLELNSYEQGEETVNGHVLFDEEKKLKIKELRIDPNKYHIYDYVEVVGLVSSYKEESDKVIITLKDAKVIANDLYQSYELVVNNIDNREVTKALGDTDKSMYYMGISGIYYKYTPEDIYELPYLIADKRESIKNLTKDVEPEIIGEDNRLYTLEEFKILDCTNGDTYFINKNISYYDNICPIKEN